METGIDLKPGVDSFTHLDLLRRAAAHKGLKLCEDATRAYSEPIKTYVLDQKLLAALAERRIKRQDRPDCNHEIFTLVDENEQEKVPGWAPSNYWNFKLLEKSKHKFDLRIKLCVGFGINLEKRGVVLVPQAHGSFVSAGDELPNFRMFKALIESDKDSSIVAKELAASDGSIVVTWTDLGLGGIRKLSLLFEEFASFSKAVRELGGKEEIFQPVPYPRHVNSAEELFITEPAQPKVFQAWRAQLKDYRLRLVA